MQGELFEKAGKYFYHAVATNWLEEEKDGWEGLEWHNKRGQAETFNKEIKNWVRDGSDAAIRVQNKRVVATELLCEIVARALQ